MMICSFCSFAFEEEEGRQDCSRCALFGGCQMVKCPRCGYEMPRTPDLVKMLKDWSVRRFARSKHARGG